MTTTVQVAEKRRVRINLSKAHLPGANLTFAQLKNADFHGANLTDADFEGAVLCGANFSDARLINANFQDADLRGADFSKSDLSNASFVGATVSDADFSNVTLHGTDLCDTDITKVLGLGWDPLLNSKFNSNTKLPENLRKDDLLGYLETNYPKFRWQRDGGDDLSVLISSLLELQQKFDESSIWKALYKFNISAAE